MRRLIAIPLQKSVPLPPPVPTPTISAAVISANEIDLTLGYNGPPTLASLFLQVSAAATGPFSTVATATSPGVIAQSMLGAATTYYFRCYAVTGETPPRTSAFSAVVSATTQSTSLKPPQVTGLTATPSPSSVTLNWSQTALATNYLVYDGSGNLLGSPAAGTTTFAITGLLANTPESYYVVAFNSVGQGPPSVIVNTTTLAAVPPSAVLQATAATTSSAVVVTANAPADFGGDPPTGYLCTLSPGGAFTRVFVSQANEPASVQISVAGTPGTAYTAKIHAFNNEGAGPDVTVGPVTIPASTVTPPAPTQFVMTGQGQNEVDLAWAASVGGPNPVSYYKIYRGGALYASNITGLAYKDLNATNTNQPTSGGIVQPAASGTSYNYTVSAVDNQGNEGPQQTLLTFYGYLNGVKGWLDSDYSYGATVNYNDTSLAPEGGTACIKVTNTAANGIFQPYTGLKTTLWDLQCGAFQYAHFRMKAIVTGQDWSMSFVSRQPSPTGDVFSYKHVLLSSYVAGNKFPVGSWVELDVPLADVTIGLTNFTGTLGAPYGSYTYDSNGDTWHTATLTVPAGWTGVGVDVGAFITGAGIPADTFICATNQQSSTGTFVGTGPNITASTSANGTMLGDRTDLYKMGFIDQTGQSNNAYGVDNMYVWGSQQTGQVGQAPGYDGIIKVQGNKFVNGSGATIQLRGANFQGLEASVQFGDGAWYGQPPNWSDWGKFKGAGGNAVRIPVEVASLLNLTCRHVNSAGNGWNGGDINTNPTGDYFQSLDAAIAGAQSQGCYVILDLHWSGPQLTFGGVTRYVMPTGQPPFMNADTDLAGWKALAQRYGNNVTPQSGIKNTGIIFELFNEPFLDRILGEFNTGMYALMKNGGTCSTFQSSDNGVGYSVNQNWNVLGYETVRAAIRALGATNPIMCNGPSYASSCKDYLQYTPTDSISPPQICVGAHLYPDNSQTTYPGGNYEYPGTYPDNNTPGPNSLQYVKAVLAGGLAVVCTEDGGQAGTGATSGEPHITYMTQQADALGFGYIIWQYWPRQSSNFNGNNNTATTANNPLLGAGVVFQNWIKAHAP